MICEITPGHAVSRGQLAAEISQIAVLDYNHQGGGGNDNDVRPSLLAAERKGTIGRLDRF